MSSCAALFRGVNITDENQDKKYDARGDIIAAIAMRRRSSWQLSASKVCIQLLIATDSKFRRFCSYWIRMFQEIERYYRGVFDHRTMHVFRTYRSRTTWNAQCMRAITS